MRLARSALPTAAAAVALAALAVPTTAAADGGNSCRKQAKVVDGTVTSIDKTTGDIGTDTVKVLKRAGQVYAVPEDGGDATIRFQHVTYVLEPGSQFALGCFGESAAEGAKFPRVILGVGELTAKFAQGAPGAQVTQQAQSALGHLGRYQAAVAQAGGPPRTLPRAEDDPRD